MCQYLFAEFSLKSDGLTGEQQAAVDRWRRELHDIAVQEMLHLALVANLMASIGAAPTFGRPNFPQACGAFPPSIQMRLLPFGEAALSQRVPGLRRPGDRGGRGTGHGSGRLTRSRPNSCATRYVRR
jgi:hypothetical protein